MGEFQSYRIKQPHYRLGKYYPAGSVVTVPADEKPPATWEKVTEVEAQAKPFVSLPPEPVRQEDAPKAPKSKRSSDRDV